MRRLMLCLVMLVSACGKSSPSGPTPTPTATRIITVGGVLTFGSVNVGSTFELGMPITNSGTATLTITGMTGPNGYTSDWTQGTIPAGTTHLVRVTFRPTEPRTYNGTVTVNGDQTSGINTKSVTGTGLGPLFTKSGSGNTVFDMPTYVTRVRIKGEWNRTSNSNFIVRIGGQTEVNEILRDSITYEGIHLVTGGVVEIISSANITWSFEEVR